MHRTAAKAALAIACLFAAPLALAATPSKGDYLCLKGVGAHPTQLEFHWLSDTDSDWRGAYVRYGSSKSVIPLVLKSSEGEELAKGRPWQYTEVWVEVLKGEVTGEYTLTYQGAIVVNFDYRNRKSGKTYGFIQAMDAMEEGDHCHWQ